MARIEHQYVKLLHDIIKNGVVKEDRTGTGTISVFGRQIRHDMSEGFPLLTTKRMYWKGIVTELLWFLRGDTNIKYLVDNNCHIWDGDAYKNYERRWESEGKFLSPPVNKFTKEEFVNEIKTNWMIARELGELGPIYGKQWRDWGGFLPKLDGFYSEIEYESNGYVKGIDQIQNLIEQLKTNPDSRRLMVNAWNVGDLDKMTLPPCHYGFQVYTSKRQDGKRYISLMWNQRSVDTFLGLPFNIASYALLLKIIAKEVNMIPDELIGNLGDVHLYKNHIEQAKEQMTRDINHEPELVFKDAFWDLCDKNIPFSDKINEYKPDWFTIENYMPHPPIKAPLSN